MKQNSLQLRYMIRLSILALSLLLSIVSFGQNERKCSAYLGLYSNFPIYDAEYSPNGNGIGLNLDLYPNNKLRLRPKLEANTNMFMTEESYVTDADGHQTPSKNGTTSIFIGPAYNLTGNFEISFNAGTCLVQSKLHLGLKPCAIFYPGKKKILKLELSFTNIFQPDAIGGGPFGFLSFGVGAKSF